MEKIRIINHWACSGGTLISKCIASMPSIVFLNEVHPYAYLRLLEPSEQKYIPTDIIQQLCLNVNKKDPSLCIAAFVGAIEELNKKDNDSGKKLILRNHSHCDFFVGPFPRSESLLDEIFAGRNNLVQVLTVRHPLDSWLSITKQNWDKQIQFNSFEEYCSRVQVMIKAMKNLPIVHYEKFCLDPKTILKEICFYLDIEYTNDFENFSSVVLSGDSGRSSKVIEPRERRQVPENLLRELNHSNAYLEICEYLNYNHLIDGSFPYLKN